MIEELLLYIHLMINILILNKLIMLKMIHNMAVNSQILRLYVNDNSRIQPEMNGSYKEGGLIVSCWSCFHRRLIYIFPTPPRTVHHLACSLLRLKA